MVYSLLFSLPGPVVTGGYAPEFVNVADQRKDPESLLSFFRLLIAGAGVPGARLR